VPPAQPDLQAIGRDLKGSQESLFGSRPAGQPLFPMTGKPDRLLPL